MQSHCNFMTFAGFNKSRLCLSLEVLDDQLPSATSSEDVHCKHEDIGALGG